MKMRNTHKLQYLCNIKISGLDICDQVAIFHPWGNHSQQIESKGVRISKIGCQSKQWDDVWVEKAHPELGLATLAVILPKMSVIIFKWANICYLRDRALYREFMRRKKTWHVCT